MNKRDVLEVGIKLIGLYLVVSFLGSLSVVAAVFSVADSKLIENKPLYEVITCFASLFYLFFAVAFLWRGRRIAEMLTRDATVGPDTAGTALLPCARLAFWVRILGLYFFIAVSSRLVSALAQAGSTIRGAFWWSRIVGEVFEICLALVFIFKNEHVSQIVEEHGESDRAQGV